MAVRLAIVLFLALVADSANAANQRNEAELPLHAHEMLAALPGGSEVAAAFDVAHLFSTANVSGAVNVLDSPLSHAIIAALPGGEASAIAEALDFTRYAARSSSSFLTAHNTHAGASKFHVSEYPTVLFGALGGLIIGAVGGNAELSGGPGSLKCGFAGGIAGGILGLVWDLMDFVVAQKKGPSLNEGGDVAKDTDIGEIIELPEPSLEKMHQLALSAVALSDYEESRAKVHGNLGEQLQERAQERTAVKALDDIVDRIKTKRKEPMNQSEGDFEDIQEVLSEGDTAELMTAEAAKENNALVTANDLARLAGTKGSRLRGEDIGPAGDLNSFQGDMIPAGTTQVNLLQALAGGIPPGQAAVAAGATWEDATVNFCFASDVSTHAKHIFRAAANQYQVAVPCLQFVDVGWLGGSSTSPETEQRCGKSPAIFVQSNPKEGCYSYVGMVSSRPSQRLQLQEAGCVNIGTAVHELGHALGMAHEQARPDRDKHVKIHWNNIAEGKKYNFDIVDNAYTDARYDILSIMHYDRFAFARDPDQPTMDFLGKGVQDELGQRSGLSSYDVSQLVAMYKVTNEQCKGNALAGMGCINKPDDSGEDVCDIEKCNSKAASHCCACGGGIQVQCYEGQDCPKSDPLPDLEASECIEDATPLFPTSSYPCIYTNVCKFNVEFNCPGFDCVHKVRSKSYEVAQCNKMFVNDICLRKESCKVTRM